jgi:two-component system cell cycle response regulator DivK
VIVLVVDDNEKNLKLACDVLRHAGIDTLRASTAGEAITIATQQLPDVVLMDIRLPDMDGTEAVRELKAAARTSAIPVVALTSFAMKGDRERFLAVGFDGYIEKPISVRDFPGQVRGVLASP